jgi:hypothetical protein
MGVRRERQVRIELDEVDRQAHRTDTRQRGVKPPRCSRPVGCRT